MSELKTTKDFNVEFVGEVEDYVYDIEVEDCHNFFANDILVHNSCYFSLESVIKKLSGKETLKYSDDLISQIDAFCEGFIAPKIARENEAIANDLNAPFNVLAMKREKICESGFWVAKKRYAVKVWDDEGLRLKEPKYAITGLEIKRSNTPKFAQEKLLELVKVLLGDNAGNAPKVLEQFRADYTRGEILEIGLPMGVSSMASKEEFMRAAKKPVIPQHVRGALVYNELIRLKGLEGTYKKISNGTKVFRYMLKPNPISKLFAENAHGLDPRLGNARVDVISIPQDLEDIAIIEFFKDFIDRDRMFGVALGEAGARMVEACGISTSAKSSLDDFF